MSRDYSTIQPWSQSSTLPRLSQPHASLNGRIEKSDIKGFKKFQWQPSDTRALAHDSWSHTFDELFYTVNRQNFRADQFNKVNDKPVLMSLGDSYTYGIGVRDAETWPSIVANKLDMVNWNMSSGGGSNQDMYFIFQQMISAGYIPDVVCIMWSFKERSVVSRNVISPVVEETDIMPAVGPGSKASGSGSLTYYLDGVTDGVGKPMRNDPEQRATAYSKSINTMLERRLNVPVEQRKHVDDIHHKITTKFQGVGNDVEIKSSGSTSDAPLTKSLLLQSMHTDAEYTDFFIIRSAIVNLCKAHNIKVRETFQDHLLHKFALAYIVPVEGWSTGPYPLNPYTLQEDYARDSIQEGTGHFGPATLEAIANYYLSTLHNERKLYNEQP